VVFPVVYTKLNEEPGGRLLHRTDIDVVAMPLLETRIYGKYKDFASSTASLCKSLELLERDSFGAIPCGLRVLVIGLCMPFKVEVQACVARF
jgi:hypothetical protein